MCKCDFIRTFPFDKTEIQVTVSLTLTEKLLTFSYD